MKLIETKNRDEFLDIAKGLAIILVVIGHVIQGSSANFDDLLGFRIIYSFHMPLFVFLSGAVASIGFDSRTISHELVSIISAGFKKIIRASFRLLLPFIAWCILNQLIYHHADDVVSALILAFRRPDTALWFLLAIFYCIVLINLFQVFFALLLRLICVIGIHSKKMEDLITNDIVQIGCMIFIWWLIKTHTPHGAGLGLLKPYFIYYALGICFYKSRFDNISTLTLIFTGILFLSLSLFWSRTADYQYAGSLVFPSVVLYFWAGSVAILGTWFLVGCAQMISASTFLLLKKFLGLSGQLSLGIYATHYFFLAYPPKVIAPLFMSIAISFLLNTIPVVRTVFLGER